MAASHSNLIGFHSLGRNSLLEASPNQRIELTPEGATQRCAVISVAGAVYARRWASLRDLGK